jgi:hypothetical protein
MKIALRQIEPFFFFFFFFFFGVINMDELCNINVVSTRRCLQVLNPEFVGIMAHGLAAASSGNLF